MWLVQLHFYQHMFKKMVKCECSEHCGALTIEKCITNVCSRQLCDNGQVPNCSIWHLFRNSWTYIRKQRNRKKNCIIDLHTVWTETACFNVNCFPFLIKHYWDSLSIVMWKRKIVMKIWNGWCRYSLFLMFFLKFFLFMYIKKMLPQTKQKK